MEILGTKCFIPKGFELGSTLSSPNGSIADSLMIQIETCHKLLCSHMLQPFTVVQHGGDFCFQGKTNFTMYLTYLYACDFNVLRE